MHLAREDLHLLDTSRNPSHTAMNPHPALIRMETQRLTSGAREPSLCAR